MSDARALWAVAPGRCELRDETLPALGADDVLVEASWSAVSKGTEGLVLSGRVPASQHEAMRGPHMGGGFPFPVKYGYCVAGTVVEGALPVGTQVFCLHPHQDRFVVPVSWAVPHHVPAERAVLAANVETALNVVWDSGAGPGDRVVVVGGGVVGCLVAWLAGQLPGAEVVLVDVLPERAAVAEALGVSFARPDEVAGDADVVVHASATEAGARTALGVAGHDGMVVEASWFGDRSISLPLGEAFHSRRLVLRSSQVGQIPPQRRPRWTHRRRLEKALELCGAPGLDALFTGSCTFDELPERLPEVVVGSGLCHRVDYRGR